MGIRDLLKKRDALKDAEPADPAAVTRLATPEFTFIRSDTFTQEVIQPPTTPAVEHGDDSSLYLTAGNDGHGGGGGGGGSSGNRLSLFAKSSGRSRSNSASSSRSVASVNGSGREKDKESAARRISHRLHLHRTPESSDNVPGDLPEIVVGPGEDDGSAALQWEKRATMLARENEKNRSRPPTPTSIKSGHAGGISKGISVITRDLAGVGLGSPGYDLQSAGSVPPSPNGVVSSKAIDGDIQEAIRLHEEGDLQQSTALFGKLADPNGSNNPLSQVLYGLALRHGWGCQPDPERAIKFLSAAASNAATIEQLALQAGLKKGGAAKGELVLAIFELANCFRNGWGIPKDPIAAKQYYETAANLGDSDAMNEVGWCYLEGFGCKKDKFAAAKYYRLAEQNGNKTLGNSWIWKDKYNPENAKK